MALDGSLRPVAGVLPMALAAAEAGVQALYLPADNAAEAAEACGSTGMCVYPAQTVTQVVEALEGETTILPTEGHPLCAGQRPGRLPRLCRCAGTGYGPPGHGGGRRRGATMS